MEMNKIPKFIYIDDEDPLVIESFIHGLNDTQKVEIERLDFTNAKSLEDVCNLINTHISDGLLMDLRLDGEGVNRLGISATPIAQQLRTLAAQKEMPEFPIILCSTLEKLKATYEADIASHDLFDYKFTKTGYDRIKVATKMATLANSYKRLNTHNTDIFELIGRTLPDTFDNRIFERYITNTRFGAFDFLTFIIKELFHHSGVLIKENILAARLGIDIEASGEAWNDLLVHLTDTVYSGILSEGWKRYWADLVNVFFENISNGELLPVLTATERVNILKKKFNLDGLKPAQPIKYCCSSMFWSICEGFKKPLDPAEGYDVFESDVLKSWQEPKYLSFAAVISERYPEIRLTSEARAKFAKDKKELQEKRSK